MELGECFQRERGRHWGPGGGAGGRRGATRTLPLPRGGGGGGFPSAPALRRRSAGRAAVERQHWTRPEEGET